jgi:orotidine-5'-phosphate decarboxylase
MREKLALAADLPLDKARELYARVQPYVGVVKVGLSLFVEHGPKAVEAFKGASIFLDLKLHDIPNTVELASARAAALGVKYLTVHASGGRDMLEAARRGAQDVTVLAVTVLTSLDSPGLNAVGVADSPRHQAERLARLARECGIGGIVCSAAEVAEVRKAVGPGVVLCTPGNRPSGAAKGDQMRVETPKAAISAGADLLVVGRPIYEAADPVAAAKAIHDEIAAAAAPR